ncbi:Hemin-binding periplasmic protein HmuT [Meiothermus luteus]|jgi:iron complex transport system substrate-binding protein|uniref:Hemin-binding periplasmic protein HmuT n=1 Tax=Meiothermus luteus TaxID=2026184 RepID=A0A399EXH3_9DEIN|nr:ABC transporter substrate-binding protein [Meiothermus luteus]RIH87212.1 Hemin-binding periplasmic protein HmuT [Meiothermus luteus]RMH54216.1 MAG: hemin ABC transporter substrate-binding protein [Deinococcota bacterium]
MRQLVVLLWTALLLAQAQPLRLVDATGQEIAVASTERIVSLDMTSTEILFALGAGPKVVARDGSSVYPPEAQKLPVVGLMAFPYVVDNILAQNPTVVVGKVGLKPDDLAAQLKARGVPYVQVPAEPGVEPTKARIRLLAKLVGQVERGEALVAALERDLAQLKPSSAVLRGVFMYMRGPSMVFICGRSSNTAGLIELVGAKNAADWDECRPSSPELLAQLNPDFVVVLQSGLGSVGGLEGFLRLPGVAQTQAGQAHRVIAVADGLSAAGGPRLGKAAQALHRAIFEHSGFVEVNEP